MDGVCVIPFDEEGKLTFFEQKEGILINYSKRSDFCFAINIENELTINEICLKFG